MLTGNEEVDRARMMEAAQGPIDCVLDILPPSVRTQVVRAAVMSVRPYGRVILMGGVGMLGGGDDLALPYPWIMRNDITVRGKWMYPPEAVRMMVGLVRAGLLRLEEYAVTEFALSRVNEAIAHAAANGGPFRLTVPKTWGSHARQCENVTLGPGAGIVGARMNVREGWIPAPTPLPDSGRSFSASCRPSIDLLGPLGSGCRYSRREMIRFVRECGIGCHTRIAWLVMASNVDLRRSAHKDET